MWPFEASTQSLWLGLYLATFALHAVFVSSVAIGSAYALVRKDELAGKLRDWLPFMLGAGITAGVAPLLFLQLLYQRRFYTANLLLGPRWAAVVPALIVGFYALYLAKASVRWCRPALGLGLACFLFVAWSWTELHQLMLAEPAWRAMYAAGDRLYADASIVPRLGMWLGAMAALFALVAAHLAPSRLVALIALKGLVLATVCALVIGWSDAHGWAYILVAAVAVAAGAWGVMLATPHRGLPIATGATAAALVAGAVVREAPRLAFLEPVHAEAAGAGGLPVFAITLAIGVAAIAWIVRTVRAA